MIIGHAHTESDPMPSPAPQVPGGPRRFPRPARLYGLPLGLLAATALTLAPSPATGASAAAAPAAENPVPAVVSTPFAAGDDGYHCARIPALVTTGSGALLAFAEGRVRGSEGCSDVGDNDIVMKKSTDGGATWGPLKVLVGAGTDRLAHGNPAPVVDAVTGRISLLYSSSDWNRDQGNPSRAGFARTVWAAQSSDDGTTWSRPAEQPQLKPAGWNWVSTGPGHGIQLARGSHRGRLVVPGDHTAASDTTAGIQLYYSDDGGLTWELGARSEAPKTGPYPAEPTVAETAGTADGSLYVSARNSENVRCATDDHRLAATSPDGGAGFAPAGFAPVTDLDTSPTYGSLLRLHSTDLDGRPDRLLYSGPSRLGPNPLEDRRELAIRSSTDEGRTWQTAGTLITPGRSGYSDLTLLADRSSIGVVYETATTIPHGSVVFTSFTEARMDAARTELRRPRTPDTSAHHNDAVVHGGARLGLRADGKAMEFDGKDDYLRLVGCTEALRVRQQDFTVTAWFRHAATGGGLPIVWAYGMSDAGRPNPKVRQFWLKAEPGQKRLRAAIQTDTSYAEVKTDSAYNDGAWHHVVFKREAGRLLLSVDGGTEFSAPAPAGDITPPGQFNIHVGARPDFPNQATGVKELFNGGLDDVRLFGRALTRAESAKVRAGATDVATDQERLRLAFETTG
ncbi:sialidase family protein [Streptomyces sp. MJM1172]|uniref:sialidase family protein n=1 Tax=Streptomyces sp. MJM1172 TaxID=1703926 RepID=UPI000A5F69DB|nr:sialidase family protein [Streptomyces sp. MJM1172]